MFSYIQSRPALAEPRAAAGERQPARASLTICLLYPNRQFFTARHAFFRSSSPAPSKAAAMTFLPASDVERPPLPSSGNSAPTGALGGAGGGAKRFLNAPLRLPTMFMYMKGDAGT